MEWVRDQNTVFHFGGQGISPNFQAGSTFGLDMDAYPNMQFYSWGNDILFDAGVPQERWVHIVITYDGRTVRIYTQGQQRAAQPMALNTALTNLEIGGFGRFIQKARRSYRRAFFFFLTLPESGVILPGERVAR